MATAGIKIVPKKFCSDLRRLLPLYYVACCGHCHNAMLHYDEHTCVVVDGEVYSVCCQVYGVLVGSNKMKIDNKTGFLEVCIVPNTTANRVTEALASPDDRVPHDSAQQRSDPTTFTLRI